MTPTRALIEAAEDLVKNVSPVYGSEMPIFRKLRAAISSAKAAEEGVETAWVIECKMNGFTETWLRDDLESGQSSYLAAVRDYPNADCIQLLRKDDYTTLISVR
jgi:hypothetical protein